jgi:alpha/beta superfamily hydrolase
MIEECLTLAGTGVALEARLAYAEDLEHPTGAVLICPPHPFLGGDMDNNVVQALTTALAAAGLPVLRFNYRGIGASSCARDLSEDQRLFWRDSTCPGYEAEMHVDCADAFAALQKMLPTVPGFSVIGYSFGCLPALAIAAHTPLAKLCLISPPLAKWAIAPAAFEMSCPRALCYAPDDFACPAPAVQALYDGSHGPREIHAFAAADHFFIGHETSLAATVVRFMVAP